MKTGETRSPPGLPGRMVRALARLLALLLCVPAGLFAQAGGQVTQLTITNPDPQATQQRPLRTSRDFFPITFSHNGASGSYFVNTDGADIEGSAFDGGPGQTVTEVAAGFDVDGPKPISLVLFQTRFNITVRTQQSVNIQFDSTAPTFQVQRLVLAAGEPPQPFTAGATIFTSTPQLGVQGTVQDPDNGSPSEEIQFNSNVGGTAGTFTGVQGGTFDGQIDLGTGDGEKVVQLTAQDAFPDDAPSRPNVSAPPFEIRVVLDTRPAAVNSVTIIRDPQSQTDRVEFPAGPQVFVGRNAIQIRVEFSEPLRRQPDLRVTQNGGTAILATPNQSLAIDNRIFIWDYTPIPQDAQNGPAQIEITNVLDRAGNSTTGDPRQTIAEAFRVDTIEPVRIRFVPRQAGDTVSDPEDGARIGPSNFPRTIRVFVEDYDTRDLAQITTTNASGVLFRGVERGTGQGPTNPKFLTIRLVSPAGDVLGTPSIAPPNGIFYQLPDFTDPSLALVGFRDRDGDGRAEPVEGAWRIEVRIQDQVGNTNTQTFQFTVDDTPIDITSLIVRVDGFNTNPNPLQRGVVSCFGGPPAQTASASPTIVVTSTDPTFSTTRSEVQFLSRIGGANSQPVRFDAAVARTAAGIELTNVREPGKQNTADNFPVPDRFPGQFLPPGVLDPRLGIADGIYLVRVIPEDDARNRGVRDAGVKRDFAEFQVNLDTVTPFTRRTFPADASFINEPLRFVDAIVVDPESPANGNPGCGIDVNRTELIWRLEAAYRPSRVDRNLIQNPPVGNITSGALRGLLRFVHQPNNTDPNLPSFNENDDAFRVLLELTDNRGFVRSLPTDGSMDGIYSIGVNPVDGAGNSLVATGSLNPQGTPPRSGTYFGLGQPRTPETTIDITGFFFLYDTIDPELRLTDFPEGSFIGGPTFTIRGDALDLSAQNSATFGSAGNSNQGGSDIDRVEVLLEVVDQNGTPIPSVPAAASTTNPSIFTPAQENPVIPTRLAVVEPVRNDPANASPSTTRTLIDLNYQGRTLERRNWSITASLPSRDRLLRPRTNVQGDFYRLTVTAVDRAGNRTSVQRRVVVSLDFLRPPQLSQPPCNSFRNKPSTTFEWVAVPGAVSYTFELTDPRGAVTRRVVTEPRSLQNLITEGEYRWRVASMDAAGNLGAFTQPCSVTLDRTPPSVISITHADPIEPGNNNGVINTGDVDFTVRFSETLDVTKGVLLQLDPKGAVGVDPQTVTTTSQAGDTWVGRVRIPADANPANWDGLATLIVKRATDRAGNVMSDDLLRTVEIDTGPFFTTRFFLSPMNDREITVAIVASEDLIEPPTLTSLRGVTLIDFTGTGPTPKAKPVPGDPRASFLTMRLDSAGNTAASFDLTGQDLALNSAKRSVSFQVIPPRRESSSAITARGMALTVGPGATGGRSLYVFPPLAEGSAPEAVAAISQALSVEAGGSGAEGPELEHLGFTETLTSSGPLAGEIEVAVPLQGLWEGPTGGEACIQIGVYELIDGEWVWVGRGGADGFARARIRRLGPMKLARDAVPPVVEPPDVDERTGLDPSRPIRFKVRDGGSGVDPATIQVTVGGTVVAHEYDPDTGTVTIDLKGRLEAGTHALQLAAKDRGGNPAQTQAIGLSSAGGFGFSDPPLAVPNPARVSARIRFDLTQPGVTEDVSCVIYDAAGRKIRSLRASGGFTRRDNRIDWDLRDARGGAVGNGVYFFEMRVRGQGDAASARGKIAVLR